MAYMQSKRLIEKKKNIFDCLTSFVHSNQGSGDLFVLMEIPEFCSRGNHGNMTGANNRVDPQALEKDSMTNVSKTL